MKASYILKAIAKDVYSEDFNYVEIIDGAEEEIKEQVKWEFGTEIYIRPGEYMWMSPEPLEDLYADYVFPYDDTEDLVYLYRIED